MNIFRPLWIYSPGAEGCRSRRMPWSVYQASSAFSLSSAAISSMPEVDGLSVKRVMRTHGRLPVKLNVSDSLAGLESATSKESELSAVEFLAIT
ncbi:hypothetical protein [Muribaculum intestinale]|uniref:hypothetical protein n=1 Tax=Muribaculum intestinale TaxID=1796646 RepID=UPI003F678F6D